MEIIFTVGYYALGLFIFISAICILDTLLQPVIRAIRNSAIYLFNGFSKSARITNNVAFHANRIQYRNFKTVFIIGNLLLFLKKHFWV